MKPTILTYSGRYFDYSNPDPESFTIIDLAMALSRICRFGGHCQEFYSVAQHSVLASYLVPKEKAFKTLMHDAHEALVGDMPSPMKLLCPDYKMLEKKIERVVLTKFGIDPEPDDDVKLADMIMLKTEQRDLMLNTDEWSFAPNIKPMPVKIVPASSDFAMLMFMKRFNELCPIGAISETLE